MAPLFSSQRSFESAPKSVLAVHFMQSEQFKLDLLELSISIIAKSEANSFFVYQIKLLKNIIPC